MFWVCSAVRTTSNFIHYTAKKTSTEPRADQVAKFGLNTADPSEHKYVPFQPVFGLSELSLFHRSAEWSVGSETPRLAPAGIQTQSKSQEFPSSRCEARWSQIPGVLRTVRKATDMKREAT
ncbi:hypothetical protein XENORESO_015352 [Xenotaenia resolanae]|uniref:Uncharacterized protein n=1 Tax=Xenotaenia resolanae TaxID=208358 RepID=A0ABV0VZI8_9TELE